MNNTRIYIYPTEPDLREYVPAIRDFSHCSARFSRVGTAEIYLNSESIEDINEAFTWIKNQIPNGETSGVICYSFIKNDKQGIDSYKIMNSLCENVKRNQIDENTVMVTGISKKLN